MGTTNNMGWDQDFIDGLSGDEGAGEATETGKNMMGWDSEFVEGVNNSVDAEGDDKLVKLDKKNIQAMSAAGFNVRSLVEQSTDQVDEEKPKAA